MSRVVWIYALLLLLLVSCANTSNPTGGEGDKTPPKLMSSNPASYSTSLDREATIELHFSEWVDPKSASKGIQISPKVDSGVTIQVRGRKVKISPNTQWNESRTYHISTNSELIDFSGNALDSVTDIVFATSAELDSGTLYGIVNIDPTLKQRPKVGLILAEHLNEFDTTLLSTFDYFTQCDSMGHFSFTNISSSEYHVVGFIDGNSDNRITPGEVAYLHRSKVTKTGKDTLTLLKASTDTTALKLDKLRPLTPNLLYYTIKSDSIPYNTKLSSLLLTKEGDTVAKDLTPALSLDSSFFTIELTEKLKQEQYTLITQLSRPFVDTTGLPHYFDTTLFNGITESDTTKPTAIKVTPLSKNSGYAFSVNWSIPVRQMLDTVYLKDTSDTSGSTYPFVSRVGIQQQVHYEAIKPIPTELSLLIDKKDFHSSSLTSVNNVVDSTDTTLTKLKTRTPAELAHSLTIVLDSVPSSSLLKIWGSNSSTEYLLPITGDTLSLAQPLAGKYRLAIVTDENKNQMQDLGSLFPFRRGEKIRYLSDTLKIPPRWEVEHSIRLIEEVEKPEKQETPLLNSTEKKAP